MIETGPRSKLRDQPEAALLAKRALRKSPGDVTSMVNPLSSVNSKGSTLHARIGSADESSKTFTATLDRKTLGELNADVDDAKQTITLRALCADNDEWQKVSQGAYSHLKIEHDMDGRPSHVSLSDTAQSEHVSHTMKLAKRDGSVENVAIKPRFANASGPMLKRDGALDPFKAIHRAGPQRGRL